ncbi:hypothetical protein AAMO2058_000436300 [Amorphochlora amoebiformis]
MLMLFPFILTLASPQRLCFTKKLSLLDGRSQSVGTSRRISGTVRSSGNIPDLIEFLAPKKLRRLMGDAADSKGNLRYFAYGSNLCDDVFKQARQLSPATEQRAVVKGYRLTFPAPSAASLRPEVSDEVHGIVYGGLSRGDFVRLWMSEGGNSFYDVDIVTATIYNTSRTVSTLTLVEKTSLLGDVFKSLSGRFPENSPSGWYIDTIRRGAREKGLS